MQNELMKYMDEKEKDDIFDYYDCDIDFAGFKDVIDIYFFFFFFL